MAYKKERPKAYMPGPIETLMVLAEDAGLVKLVQTDKHPTFEDGMVRLAFFGLPDQLVYAFAFASLGYALLQIGVLG